MTSTLVPLMMYRSVSPINSKQKRYNKILKTHEINILKSVGQVYIDVCRADERVQETKPNSQRHQSGRLRDLLREEQRDEPHKRLSDLQGDQDNTRQRRRWENQIIDTKND